MKGSICLALVCLVSLTCSSDTERFHYSDEDMDDLDSLMKIIDRPRVPERYLPDDYFKSFGGNPNTRLKAFSFKNCGDPTKETIKLLQLQITPDPIKLPGPIGISFFLDNVMEDKSPIAANVELKKKILGLWVPVPCINNIGSCSYPDVCELLNLIQCPSAFADNGIPCNCPIPMGNFTLPSTNFEVPLSGIPSGDYSAQVTLTLDSGNTACYQVEVTLA